MKANHNQRTEAQYRKPILKNKNPFKMKTITELRANAILDKKIRVDSEILTRREWMEKMKNLGHSVKECIVPAIQHNRIKYNRMGIDEQKAHEKRLAEKKTEYRLYTADTEFYTITKTEFNYFNSL